MRIHIIFFIAAIIFGTAVPPTTADVSMTGEENKFQTHLLKGKEFQKKGDLDKAQEAYEYAVSIKPDSDEAHFLLGFVFFNKFQRSHEEATKNYLYDAIANKPPSQGKMNDGQFQEVYKAYGLNPDYQKMALKEFRQTVELNPDHYWARYFIAVDHLNNKRYEKAISEYKEVLKINPNHTISLSGLGNAYYGLDDFDMAIVFYEKSIKTDDQISGTHFDLAKAYLKTGERDKAIKILKKMKKEKNILYKSLRMLIYEQK